MGIDGRLSYILREGRIGVILVARLRAGNDLLASIRDIAEKNSVRGGVILSCVGAISKARLRNLRAFPKEYPITDAERSFLTFEGKPLEIVGLSGNITDVQGRIQVHAHVILSVMEGEEVSVIAGHLLEGTIIYSFAEVILAELEGVKMVKEMDKETKTYQLFAE